MSKPKVNKQSVARRKAGLMIEPPAPRPMESDHPALHFFKVSSGTPVPESPPEQSPHPASVLPATVKDNVDDSGTGVPEYRSTGVESQEAKIVSPQPLPQTQEDQVPYVVDDDSRPSTVLAGPTRNFYRKTNHIADQVDRSLSPAESKVLDHLVRLSIGFNKNTCQVRVSTLLKRTGYRSDKTVRAALNGLVIKGMIKRVSHHNNPLGDEYLILNDSGTGVPEYRSTPVEITAVLESKITGHLNTSLKDKKNDDEANEAVDPLASLSEELRSVYEELTGGQPSASEAQRVKELARLLAAELREAATRTKGVTSPAALLATHLRRSLNQKPSAPERKDAKAATGANAEPPPAQQATGRLSTAELAEHTALLAELAANGWGVDQATAQFADGFDPEDWKLLKDAAFGDPAKGSDKPS